MIISGFERYNIAQGDAASEPAGRLERLREAMKVAAERYDDLQVDIMADDHDLAAVARDVIAAHASYTRYRSAFASQADC